ncbi:uncharacterized protein LOC135814804 [Sycon ciliatum]|uniref:uncharacterized protein LOC135814804 n=1 Tax=Sycon ciliatum TaxID=27933 RepID=UPI0020AE12FD|eukprot:scpid73573/ scgid11688/ 
MSSGKMSDKTKLEHAVKSVTHLRNHVKRLFNELVFAPAGSSDNPDERLVAAQKNVLLVSKYMSDIEVLTAALDENKTGSTTLGGLGLLSQDESLDSSALYTRASQTFTSMRRVVDIASCINHHLNRQEQLSRPSLVLGNGTEPQAKIARIEMAPEAMTIWCTDWNGLHPRLQLTLRTVRDGVHFIRADLQAVFSAHIQLDEAGIPAYIVVHGWQEFADSALTFSEIVAKSSQHRVFQEVSSCCLLSLLCIRSAHPGNGPAVFKSLMDMLETYHTLFSDECSVCKRSLSMGGNDEGPLPPCWREIKGSSHTVCHRSCRSL